MKFAYLTASTAALLLSSTALIAQEAGGTTSLENVYLDVGGMAVQVPAAQAAEACALDEATIQQVASTRLEESGLDPSVIYGLGNETADAAAGSADSTGADAMTSTDTAAAGTTGSTGTASTDAATADAGAMDSTGTAATSGTDTAAADAGAATGTDAAAGAGATTDTAAADAGTAGTDTSAGTAAAATADASGAASTDGAAAGTTDMASADASGDMSGTIDNAQTTAADTTGAGTEDPMLQLAVCQVDQARATELGIDMSGTATE